MIIYGFNKLRLYIKPDNLKYWIVTLLFAFLLSPDTHSQNYNNVFIETDKKIQTIEGFGASLAYYEGWLTAHPNKAQVYEAIFGELSLDILRFRNAYDYDATMMNRVKEFTDAAEASLGHPISVLVSSWGPPAYLKSNNDRKNGGTLLYSVDSSGVHFNYEGFGDWWDKSLDEYNSYGIYPTYISLQNEPDFSASWETCLLKPRETVNSNDTIAGYNKALDAVFNKVSLRDKAPKILGPEVVGIGYNTVRNYVNALDVSKLYGIAHHLYHGVSESNPYSSDNFSLIGNIHPEIPHFQTEYSRGGWFDLAGLIYKTLNDENAVAYLYWDLIWDGAGLVSLDFPWDRSRWTDRNKGYTQTKEFYAFKQFSAFIHPGWKRINSTIDGNYGKGIAFMNENMDSVTYVLINKLNQTELNVKINIPGYNIDESSVYLTSSDQNCEYMGSLGDSIFNLKPQTIATITMNISEETATFSNKISEGGKSISNFPNPFSKYTDIKFFLDNSEEIRLSVFNIQGRLVYDEDLGYFNKGQQVIRYKNMILDSGVYLYKLKSKSDLIGVGKFMVGTN